MSRVTKYLRLLSFEDCYGSLPMDLRLRLLGLSLVELELVLAKMADDFENERYGL